MQKYFTPPTDFQCSQYYDLWATGADLATIAGVMGIEVEYLTRWEPVFFAACRKRAAAHARKQLTEKGIADEVLLTPERRRKFITLIADGLPIDRAALALGVPLITVTDVWFQIDPFLKDEAEAARDDLDRKVIKALYKRAVGYKRVQKVKRMSVDPMGGKTATMEEQDVEVMPSVIAAKTWLQARRPEWMERSTLEGDRGAILNEIDKMTDEALDETSKND